MVDFTNEASQAMVGVGIGVWGVGDRNSSVSKAATNSDGKGGGNNDAPEGEEESLPSRSTSGEVAIIICSDRTPTRCVR